MEILEILGEEPKSSQEPVKPAEDANLPSWLRSLRAGLPTEEEETPLPPPEEGFLWHKIIQAQRFGIMPGQEPSIDLQPLLIDHDAIAIERIDFGMLSEPVHHETQRAGQVEIV